MIKTLCFALLLAACTGSDGRDGADGTNGTNGMDGMNGTNGMDGMDGMDGTGGASGVRTVIVSPGATDIASGANLIAAITLFKSDPTKATAAKPWVIKVEPGIYDVGANGVEMQPFVDIEGSGEQDTLIKSTAVTLTTADGVELRDLTVACTGNCVAIVNLDGFPIISRVTAVLNSTQFNAAIVSQDGGPTLREVTVIASGVDAQGIEVDAGNMFIRNSDVIASGTTATYGPGGINVFDGTAFVKDSTISVSANVATDPAVGVYLGRQTDAPDVVLDDVYIAASSNIGIAVWVESQVTTPAQGVRIHDSVLSGDTAVEISDIEGAYVMTANTQLDGAFDVGADGQNLLFCTGDYDDIFLSLADGVADTTNAGGACL